MPSVASPRRPNDENSIPTHNRDSLFSQPSYKLQPTPSPRHRQPLAALDQKPNLYPAPYTPGHASRRVSMPPLGGGGGGGGASQPAADATPVRGIATKVDPDARELPLPKGLVFPPPPPPPTSGYQPMPTPTQSRTAARSNNGHMHHPPQPLNSTPHHHHSMQPAMNHTPRSMFLSHPQSTPARSTSMSYSSPSSMSHMPSTPDIRSPYPPGHPIDLHDLLPPAKWHGQLPPAFLNQGDMPSGGDANDDTPNGGGGGGGGEPTPSSTSTRRALVSCNPWDYKVEDHGKNKPRRRFSPGELDMLEILWSISHNPHKWQRQKLARWFGCTTRHLTVWFQNRRQDLKKAESLAVMAESNPDTASRALAALSRANRGEQHKFSPEQSQVIMDIVSDRLHPDMLLQQQASGSSPTPHSQHLHHHHHHHHHPHHHHNNNRGTPSPPSLSQHLSNRSHLAPYTPAPPAIAPKPLHHGHIPGPAFALKPVRRGYSLDDVCADREMSMKHRTPRPRAPLVEGFEHMNKNDPRYRDALVNMLPSELSSDAIEPTEDDDESALDVDSPTRKRARGSLELSAPRPTLPPIGLGRPVHQRHRSRSSFGRASSSDVLACSTRARNLLSSSSHRAVTDPVPSRSASAGPTLPTVPEHQRNQARLPPLASVTDMGRKRKLSRGGSWSHMLTVKHQDSFDRARAESTIEERQSTSSPVPEQTRSPTPTERESVSPRSEEASVKSHSVAPSTTVTKLELIAPQGRNIYSFSKELEPEAKRGATEMDENVIEGAQALMELFRGR
ncbi:hypothetical protein CC85DRAFT_282538 [Cutaneotrichosporon oleaginosum]|uniref:Homeobox domain-containing protein n=1 Tax=Cutaneotrichosporon oleaginosum TaxID=879819 RepID=A0A0J0XWN1_9TREE|nr:uncharacterized protein CC85DRAFT_282538 [Cutaneotrichosporon oleaginosum]KLT45456.1 hypothetical protein CC85DRAFT_282538 [Cutaneotrichosporon oleaginosum]TXT14587.1 hypothetical protein COLE_00780 [Cutaneotrichosporon oleaginosum]